ncbi:hypothetical protein DFH09DRAFT_1301440 [Mycena vulgaris]|nr:hypothetical protein DFH09DRAFT_1469985 [Mycena vulgaris]KAJ6602404.1 hypothetical protein DFH09DRAFT_1301440 [Mycena vulgaris]
MLPIALVCLRTIVVAGNELAVVEPFNFGSLLEAVLSLGVDGSIGFNPRLLLRTHAATLSPTPHARPVTPRASLNPRPQPRRLSPQRPHPPRPAPPRPDTAALRSLRPTAPPQASDEREFVPRPLVPMAPPLPTRYRRARRDTDAPDAIPTRPTRYRRARRTSATPAVIPTLPIAPNGPPTSRAPTPPLELIEFLAAEFSVDFVSELSCFGFSCCRNFITRDGFLFVARLSRNYHHTGVKTYYLYLTRFSTKIIAQRINTQARDHTATRPAMTIFKLFNITSQMLAVLTVVPILRASPTRARYDLGIVFYSSKLTLIQAQDLCSSYLYLNVETLRALFWGSRASRASVTKCQRFTVGLQMLVPTQQVPAWSSNLLLDARWLWVARTTTIPSSYGRAVKSKQFSGPRPSKAPELTEFVKLTKVAKMPTRPDTTLQRFICMKSGLFSNAYEPEKLGPDVCSAPPDHYFMLKTDPIALKLSEES